MANFSIANLDAHCADGCNANDRCGWQAVRLVASGKKAAAVFLPEKLLSAQT